MIVKQKKVMITLLLLNPAHYELTHAMNIVGPELLLSISIYL